MRQSSPQRRDLTGAFSHAPTLGLAGVVLTLAACDNPVCVFGGDCFGGSTVGALGTQAEVPPDGALLLPGAPTIVASSPSGANVASTAPIVVFFSESMAGSTLADSFTLRAGFDFGGFPIPATSVLVANGRGLILFPIQPLTVGQVVELIYDPADASGPLGGGDGTTNPALDLTGEALEDVAGTLITSFTVAQSTPVDPEILFQWPLDAEANVERSAPLLTVFDRPMNPTTFTDASYVVQFDGEDPDPDAAPSALDIGPGGTPVLDSRVWTYSRVDGDGAALDLPSGVNVDLTLSPVGNTIAALDGAELAASSFGFSTASINSPLGGSVLSNPNDAIGIANLAADSADPLRIQVDLDDAETGDRLLVYLFGTEINDDPEVEPVTVAVLRTVELTEPEPIVSTELDLAELDLTNAAGEAIFEDGGLFIGLALSSGLLTSPVRVLDLDPDAAGIQGLSLDTTAPTLTELAFDSSESGFDDGVIVRSDLRDLVLSGFASEDLRAASITTALGSTDPFAPIVGSRTDGAFITQSVPLGVLAAGDQDLAFELIVFDRALNASEPVSGTFRQVGSIGPDLLAPGAGGQPIAVEVVDAITLQPIEAALVATHADAGDGVSFPFIGSTTTDVNGNASVTSHSAGQLGTLLSIDAEGYDLFTFHGLPAARVSVPLEPEIPDAAAVLGSVNALSALAQFTLPLVDTAVADTRTDLDAARAFGVGACVVNPVTSILGCPFGPQAVRAMRSGGTSAFVGDFELSLGAFSPSLLLQAAEFAIGVGPAETSGAVAFGIESLASDPGASEASLPQAGPSPLLRGNLTANLDFDNLVDDDLLDGEPDVALDVLLPGLTSPLTVGLGLAYSVGATDWTLRTAYGGATRALLEDLGIVAEGAALDDALFVRAELRDASGNLSAIRLSLGQIETLVNSMYPAGVPELQVPAPDSNTGGASFTLEPFNSLVDGVFPPATLGSGLYEAEVSDSTGRAWHIWRTDLDDDLFFRVPLHLPDLTPAGGAGLSDGSLDVVVRSAAWRDFQADAFLWSDIGRERQYYAVTGAVQLQQP